MPTLGGITAWISIGEIHLAEYGIAVEDDRVKCYVEVPQVLPLAPSSLHQGSPSGSISSPPRTNTPLSPTTSPLEYAINWRIQDLTYTMVAIVRDYIRAFDYLHPL